MVVEVGLEVAVDLEVEAALVAEVELGLDVVGDVLEESESLPKPAFFGTSVCAFEAATALAILRPEKSEKKDVSD